MRTYTAITGENTSGIIYIPIINRLGTTGVIPYEVYWIDRTAPDITPTVTNLTDTSADLVLSGINTGQLTNSMTSNLTGDDERKIITFSGVTIPSISGTLNDFRLTRTVTFFANRSGYIIVADRAGNTGMIYVNINNIGNLQAYTIQARMGFRINNNYTASGDVRIFYFSG